MELVTASREDLPQLIALYRTVTEDMEIRGLDQWHWGEYPTEDMIREDVEKGRMYCERSEDVYKGFVCTAIENAEERILYAYTKPEYRRKGVFTALAEHVIRTSTRGIRVSIPEKHPCFEAVDAVCARLGFRPTENLHTYSFDSSQKAAWQRVKAARRFDAGCARLQRRGCGVVSFEIEGGRKAAEAFMKKLKLAAIETHVADARTCCLNPATSTHRQMNEEQLLEAGVPAGLIRISCGLEDKEELIADLRQALED